MAQPQLRKCPTCLTAVEPGQLGFRDFKFLGDTLPGKVGPMDFDFVLERNGRVLIVELKPKGMSVGMGQQITYKTMVRMGCEVWLLQGEPDDDQLGFAKMSTAGRWVERRSITEREFVRMVNEWFKKAS